MLAALSAYDYKKIISSPDILPDEYFSVREETTPKAAYKHMFGFAMLIYAISFIILIVLVVTGMQNTTTVTSITAKDISSSKHTCSMLSKYTQEVSYLNENSNNSIPPTKYGLMKINQLGSECLKTMKRLDPCSGSYLSFFSSVDKEKTEDAVGPFSFGSRFALWDDKVLYHGSSMYDLITKKVSRPYLEPFTSSNGDTQELNYGSGTMVNKRGKGFTASGDAIYSINDGTTAYSKPANGLSINQIWNDNKYGLYLNTVDGVDEIKTVSSSGLYSPVTCSLSAYFFRVSESISTLDGRTILTPDTGPTFTFTHYFNTQQSSTGCSLSGCQYYTCEQSTFEFKIDSATTYYTDANGLEKTYFTLQFYVRDDKYSSIYYSAKNDLYVRTGMTGGQLTKLKTLTVPIPDGGTEYPIFSAGQMQVSPDDKYLYFSVTSRNFVHQDSCDNIRCLLSPYLVQGVYQYNLISDIITQLKPPGGVQMQGDNGPSALAIFSDGNKMATQGFPLKAKRDDYAWDPSSPSDLLYYDILKNTVSPTYNVPGNNIDVDLHEVLGWALCGDALLDLKDIKHECVVNDLVDGHCYDELAKPFELIDISSCQSNGFLWYTSIESFGYNDGRYLYNNDDDAKEPPTYISDQSDAYVVDSIEAYYAKIQSMASESCTSATYDEICAIIGDLPPYACTEEIRDSFFTVLGSSLGNAEVLMTLLLFMSGLLLQKLAERGYSTPEESAVEAEANKANEAKLLELTAINDDDQKQHNAELGDGNLETDDCISQIASHANRDRPSSLAKTKSQDSKRSAAISPAPLSEMEETNNNNQQPHENDQLSSYYPADKDDGAVYSSPRTHPF